MNVRQTWQHLMPQQRSYDTMTLHSPNSWAAIFQNTLPTSFEMEHY